VFVGNVADKDGGALQCSGCDSEITGCAFYGNTAGRDGGAVDCRDSGTTMTATNCTFSGNTGHWGGAIRLWDNASATFDNCVIWGNSATGSGNQIHADDSTATLNYCCVANGAGDYAGSGTIDDSNSCIHADPQFVDADGGDGQVGTLDDDLHLADTSPCIDAGDNSLVPSGLDEDLDGNPRIVDGDSDSTATVDIGAYEYQ